MANMEEPGIWQDMFLGTITISCDGVCCRKMEQNLHLVQNKMQAQPL